MWSEAENYDLALSFQEKAGCDEIWEKICQVSLINVTLRHLNHLNDCVQNFYTVLRGESELCRYKVKTVILATSPKFCVFKFGNFVLQSEI